jgi:hypothetical protein
VLLLARRNRSARPQALAVWTAWLCVFVMLFAVTAEARHFHGRSSSGEAQRCGVCVAAHSPGLLAKTATVTPEKVSQPLAATSEAPAIPARTLDSPCIRPPPPPESV